MADYGPLYKAAGNQFNIDPLLLQSMAVQESSQGRNQGPSTAGAQGFMQFLPETAAKYGVDAQDATSSVFGASNYLNDLMNQHGESLAHALADYGGTTPDSKYVSDVIGRYNTLKAAWAKTGPGTSGSGPAVDNDPNSPTYGQPTGKNFTPPPSAPGVDTTAKGNAGQPSPSVPTTDNAPGVSIAAPPSFAPPQGGGPKGQPAKVTEKNDPLSQAKPHVNEDGTPIAAQTAPSEANDPLSRAQPHVSESGEPIQPVDTGQYLTSATSPGAKAVGVPIAEGRVPGPAVQAAINVATDPAQKARIAASQLGVPVDSIIIGAGGRMAVAPPDGSQPYYIEPQAVFNDQSAITRDASGAWNPNPMFISPYSRASPLGPGATPSNIPLALGGAIPGTVQNYLTWAPAGLGPVLGPLGVGAASAATTAGRNVLANYLDPDKSQAQPLLTGEDVKQALINAGTAEGLRIGGALFAPGSTTALKSGLGSEVPLQFPLGEAGGARAPWENPLVLPSKTPMPAGPAERLPSTAPTATTGGALGEPGVQLNPAGEAAATSGPYAPSKAEEVAAIPTAVPVSRKPILTQTQAANRADELIRYFAAQGPTEADTRTLVPGSSGTLAGVTGNAGLASLERLVRNIPEAANRFAGADTANKEAERAFTANLIGTPEDIARGEAETRSATSAAREAAFANKTSTDPSKEVAAIDEVLQGPAGKRPAVALPLRQIRGLFYTFNPETGAQELETDPEMLYGVRQAITDALGPLSRGTDRDARAAAAQLQPILKGLDETIEAGAPGFKDYLAQFHDMSQPTDAMRFLQSRNLTDANGYPLLRPVDTLLKDIQKQRTLQPGIRPADALSDDQISQLENLRDDLRRGANLGKGKAIGSNTAQNLVGNQTLNMLTRPAAQEVGKAVATTFGGLPGYLATGAAENVLSGAVQRRQGWVLDALIDRLLNKDNLGVRALSRPGAVPLAGAGAPQTIAR